MQQDPGASTPRGQRLLDDIEHELAAIRSEVPGSTPAAARAAPPAIPAAKRAEPRVIDTRAIINLSAEGLRRTQQAQTNRKTLQQRLAEVKVVD